MIQSRYEIAADRQNLRVHIFEFANTRLVGGKFLRSTTGERGREERQHDVFLSFEIGKFDFFVVLIAQRKVGSGVADLKMRMLRRRLLRKQSGGD